MINDYALRVSQTDFFSDGFFDEMVNPIVIYNNQYAADQLIFLCLRKIQPLDLFSMYKVVGYVSIRCGF